ncbi:MAG TPA: YlbF family regulator [Clostridiaceae bacterium]
MNIYDNAHELARILKDSDEVKELREASKKIEGNDLNKKMIEDFRKIQIEAYTEQMKTGKMSKELTEKFQNFSSIISMNADVGRYLQAEQRFGVIWEDIIKILNDAVGVDMSLGLAK